MGLGFSLSNIFIYKSRKKKLRLGAQSVTPGKSFIRAYNLADTNPSRQVSSWFQASLAKQTVFPVLYKAGTYTQSKA